MGGIPPDQCRPAPSSVTAKRKKTLRKVSKGPVRIHNVVSALRVTFEATSKAPESPELFPPAGEAANAECQHRRASRVAATPNPPGFRYPVPLDRLTVKNEPTSSHLRRLSGESAVAFGKRCPLHRRLRKTGCMMKPCWAIETGSIKRPNRAGAYECENSSRFQRPSSRHPGSRSWPFRRGSACSDVSGGPGRGRGAGPAA